LLRKTLLVKNNTVDSLPKSAKVPFQKRIAFIVHSIRKTSAISDPV